MDNNTNVNWNGSSYHGSNVNQNTNYQGGGFDQYAGYQENGFGQNREFQDTESMNQYYQQMYEKERQQAEYMRQQNEFLKMQMQNEKLQRQINAMNSQKKYKLNPFSLVAVFVIILAFLLPFYSYDLEKSVYFEYADADSVIGNGTIFQWLSALETAEDIKNVSRNIAWSFDEPQKENIAFYSAMKILVIGVFGIFILILVIDSFRRLNTAKIVMSIASLISILIVNVYVGNEIDDVFQLEVGVGVGMLAFIAASVIAFIGYLYDRISEKKSVYR